MRTKHVGMLVSGLLVVPASAGLASAGASAAPAPQSTQVSIFSGNAFGTTAFVGRTAVAGKSASVALCTTKAGVNHASNVAGVSVPNLLQTGVINTSVSSHRTTTGPNTRAKANVANARVLSDVITATSLRASSTTSHDSTGFQLRGASAFVDLTVAGQQVRSHPAPNTTIRITGVGRVVLNEQKRTVGTTTASLTVNAMHVYVTKNLTGVAKGTQIIVGHATSTLGVNLAGSLDGMAYGTTVFDGNTITSGPSAKVILGCAGTDGKVKTNSVASVSVPGVISTGTVTSTAQGTITTDSAMAETTNTTQNANVLAGLVKADAVKADAHATKSGGTITLSGGGSSYTKLVVNGNPISGHVAPNTKIVVGNVTVWLHRVIRNSNSIEIRMIEVVVHGVNSQGLVKGTHIQVAVAEASAH